MTPEEAIAEVLYPHLDENRESWYSSQSQADRVVGSLEDNGYQIVRVTPASASGVGPSTDTTSTERYQNNSEWFEHNTPLNPKRRLKSCVREWAECESGEFHPSCCRFPKSCSCTIYDPAVVSEDDLEPKQGIW